MLADEAAFSAFYRRHARALLVYFTRRTYPATGALLGQHSPVVGDNATLATGVVGSITALPTGTAPVAGPTGIARVPIHVRPAAGSRRTTFTVSLRQPPGASGYTFLLTGPTGASCSPVVLPVGPPGIVAGSHAGRTLAHRLRPPADGWCPGSYRVQVAMAGRSRSGDLGSVRFRVR